MTEHPFTIIEKIVLLSGICISLGSFCFEVLKRLRIVLKGTGSLPLDRIGERLWRVFREVFLQEKVIRGRLLPGLMHGFVFWGFLVFGLVTLDHFAIGFEFPLPCPLNEIGRAHV